MVKMYCAGSRGTSQADTKAAIVPIMVRGWKCAPVSMMEYPRMLRFKRLKYQIKIPMDMKEQNTSSSIKPNDGAFQISNGSIGDFANLASHSKKMARWRIDTIRRT